MYSSPSEVARDHLGQWTEWVESEESKGFKTLAKTVKQSFEGIIRAIETGVNNAFHESLIGRIQFTKRLANGYCRRDRLKCMVFFRDSYKFMEAAV